MAFTLWLTGLPGSGKSVIAKKVKDKCEKDSGKGITILRLDRIRKTITPKPDYSSRERDVVYRSLYLMAEILNEHNINVIIDATANRRVWRDDARKLIKNFAEVYVKCPLEVCIERETKRCDGVTPKDIYEKAKRGEPVPGVNVPYEQPLNPDVTVDSDRLSVDASAKKIMEFIEKSFFNQKPIPSI